MAAGHKRLGKGPGLAFGEELTETQGTVSQVELRQIEPNPAQPRRDFGEEALAQLAESIRENGLISPLPYAKPIPAHQIVAGGAALAGLPPGRLGKGTGEGGGRPTTSWPLKWP